MIFQKKPE